ncbi:MAG: hypothetical protein KAS72_02830 [Phycisphaerales bacterium]|nr:hypothetical protein [Phycisphaerales bacterium]
MPGIIKGLVRYSVIGGLCLGGVTLLVGPQRVAAVFDQARFTVIQMIDSNIDDPIILRRQLQSLQEKYPQRIEEVEADLAAVAKDIADLEYDTDVAVRTVALVDHDLARLTQLIQMAEAKQQSGTQLVSIRYNSKRLRMPEAYAKSAQVQGFRDFCAQRAEDNHTHTGYLQQQEDRLEALLVQLRSEYTQFQSQLWQLDNQIAAIDRNERLIQKLEERERKYGTDANYQMVSLEQLHARLAELRDEQERQLAAIVQEKENISYWDMATVQLRSEHNVEAVIDFDYEPLDEAVIEFGDEIIELPEDESSLVMRD